MNENGNEKYSLLLFVARFFCGACFHVPSIAFCCSLLLVLVFVLKAKTGKYLWLLVLSFRWYEKPERATKGKKIPNRSDALQRLVRAYANDDQFAPNIDMAYNTIQPAPVPNLKSI